MKAGLLKLLLILPFCLFSDLIDLEDMTQDFVLETRQIEIPGFPWAFNPTLTRMEGKLLLTFRTYNPVTGDTNQNAFVWLDDDFNIISEPKLLEINFSTPPAYEKIQDPRIVAVGSDYYIVFNNQTGMAPKKEIRRMFVAKLFYDGTDLFTDNPEGLFHFDTPQEQSQEKNWVPFAYRNELLLAYSLTPHSILQPIFGTESCASVARTSGEITWNWGEPRGGTPALQEGDQYLAFFHSSTLMATVHSNGKKIAHYFMGAYTFSAKPPFHITAISPEPIVGKNFYHGKSYQTWKPLFAIFPCGFVSDENYIWVAYGRQDHEVWIVKLDKKGLLNSLIPVSSP